MRQVIHKLKQRPQEERKFVAFTSSVATMTILLVGWGVASLGFFGHTSPVAQTAAASDSTNPSTTDITNAAKQVQDSFSNVSNQLKAIQQQSAALQQQAQEGSGTTTAPVGQ